METQFMIKSIFLTIITCAVFFLVPGKGEAKEPVLIYLKDVTVQNRKVEFPLKSNSASGASPVRVDTDNDGSYDATRWLVTNCAWVSYDKDRYPPSIESFLISDEDLTVVREKQLPGNIGRVFGPTITAIGSKKDTINRHWFIFAGHFDPGKQMMWELFPDGHIQSLDLLNHIQQENEGPHGISFSRLDRDRNGTAETTRVVYTGELTHRCTVYEIDNDKRHASIVCRLAEGDCCRSVLTHHLDLDHDGFCDTTRYYVSLIDLLDIQYGCVKVYDLHDKSRKPVYRTRVPGVLGWPENKDHRVARATGTGAVRLDLNEDGIKDTTRLFVGNGSKENAGIVVFDLDDETLKQTYLSTLRVENALGCLGTTLLRIDSDEDGNADTTRLFASFVNRIAVYDISDNGNTELLEIISLPDYSMIYSIAPLCLDIDNDGKIEDTILGLADSWGNRLALYRHIPRRGETVIGANSLESVIIRDNKLHILSDQSPVGAGLY
ncbi:hypothetical protein ACFL60_06905, partial [Candidatus Omnitrophota bacterium]